LGSRRILLVSINFSVPLNKIKRRLFGILNFGHCDLPFDLAQGGGELVEPFGICVLLFEFFITET